MPQQSARARAGRQPEREPEQLWLFWVPPRQQEFWPEQDYGRRPGPEDGPRVTRAKRQGLVEPARLVESLVPQEHLARWLWDTVTGLDLGEFYEGLKCLPHRPGQAATDPAILVVVWLYAFCEGVCSAHKLAKLCRYHAVYRWLLGGVTTNQHTLSDFRTKHLKALQALHERVLDSMAQQGLVSFDQQALDGMRVRASAGAASFHREKTTRKRLRQARQRRKTQGTPGQRAAQRRARRQTRERLRKALKTHQRVRPTKAKKGAKVKERRVSSTDPEARVMRMGDGGYRPAYNVQCSSTPKGKVIVFPRVTNQGSDSGQLLPMLHELKRTNRFPKDQLMDGGFATKAAITEADHQGVTVYAPEQQQRKGPANTPKPTDSAAVASWRLRMATPAAQEFYKLRASTAELVNADLRAHGLVLTVRGSRKVLAIVFWAVIAYNLRRYRSLSRPSGD